MTFEKLRKIIEDNNIPEDVALTSDSGWEGDATEMDGVYYNKADNTIVFTQDASEYNGYSHCEAWRLLYGLDSDGHEVKAE